MTKLEWKLLKEIRNIKKQNEDDQNIYWKKKFEKLNYEDEVNLRSRFKVLTENLYIQVHWADDIPYIIVLTDKGKSYKYYCDKIKALNPYVKWIFGILSAIIAGMVVAKLTK